MMDSEHHEERPAPPMSVATRLFFFDPAAPRLRGVRPGWRAALFVFVAAILMGVGGALLHLAGFTAPGGSAFPPSLLYASELTSLTAVIGASLLMAWLEARNWNEYGMPLNRAFRSHYWVGIPWGIVALFVLLELMKLAGVFSFGSIILHGAAVLRYGLLWLAGFTLVGLFEEFGFRGYLLRTLSEGLTFWPAAVLLSVAFGLVHWGNHGENLIGVFSAGLIGFFFCFTLRRTGNLWFAIGMHAGWDWAESFLFGTSDSGMVSQGRLAAPVQHGSWWLSGGSVGPEGSVLVFVVIGLLFLVFHLVYPVGRAQPWAVAEDNHRGAS